MRAFPARRITTTALCATLVLGAAGPAFALQDEARHQTALSAANAPVPGADALLKQVQTLSDLGTVLTPVTDLLTAVLKADNGQLPTTDATKLGGAVKEAITKITTAAPAIPPAALPQTPALPQSPALPPAPELPALPLGGASNAKRVAAPADLKEDALKALQTAVDALLKAATSGNPTAVAEAVPQVLTGLVNTAVSTLLGSGLPVPDLPGLPKLPVPQLPVPLPVEE
ncbi:hypothetical protein [Streptomyces spectabilis]|uniref:Secreted protein n=1 Tax=Streptomyces spectabilis TaxID=68270 RepID=A0A7W8B399_STRST|nr:hypothetical protein [Streptomyces spectabilis]MBB5109560.1 hypothetical protein [Streptomyces spectabilis]GGV55795.1 hypothetical protein GCM10010245_88530 [Streptomyces spectabilis]